MSAECWRLKSDAGQCVQIASVESALSLGRAELQAHGTTGDIFSYVSRVQVLLSPAGDGVTLESRGTNPTLFARSGSSEWITLRRGESCVLKAGDRCALDQRRRLGTVFTISSSKACSSQDLQGLEPGHATASEGRWYWQSGQDPPRWTEYGTSQSEALERMWLAGDHATTWSVDLDAERHVDLRKMRQIRNDDPSRNRRVMREASGDHVAATHGATLPPAKRPRCANGGSGSLGGTQLEAPSCPMSHHATCSTVSHLGSRASPAAPIMVADGNNVATIACELTPAVGAEQRAGDDKAQHDTYAAPPLAAAHATLPTDAAAAPAASQSLPWATSAFHGIQGGIKTYSDDPSDAKPRSLVPRAVPIPADATWSHAYSALYYRCAREAPRTRVAGFDLDGTLLRWTCPSWPRSLDDYALWSAAVVPRVRSLHAAGYKIVIFGNRSQIQGAFDGKTAEKARTFTDWLAATLRVPLYALYATRKPPHEGSRFFKPEIAMWAAMEELLNEGVAVDAASSFFVGDSATDREWADNISKIKGVTMGFELPEAALGPAAGPSSTNQPSSGSAAAGVATMPDSALEARRALLGGYLDGPRMLILCGAQGAGKSTFCQMLLGNGARSEGGIRSSDRWVHVSQDTISNGKRGPREKVEAAALEALQRGVSVVVDRTHLEPDQRQHFLKVARGVGVDGGA